jgi:hypothetical protein
MPNPFLISILTLITTLATTPSQNGVCGVDSHVDTIELSYNIDDG